MKVCELNELKCGVGLLAGIIILVATASCGKKDTSKIEKIEGTEWNDS